MSMYIRRGIACYALIQRKDTKDESVKVVM